jgi:hypothetical protein
MERGSGENEVEERTVTIDAAKLCGIGIDA